jgi:hypothetical protein
MMGENAIKIHERKSHNNEKNINRWENSLFPGNVAVIG